MWLWWRHGEVVFVILCCGCCQLEWTAGRGGFHDRSNRRCIVAARGEYWDEGMTVRVMDSGGNDDANGSVMGWQPISVRNIPPSTVKMEHSTMTSIDGPPFLHISSVSRTAAQAVPSLPSSSPISTSQEMIAQSNYIKVWEVITIIAQKINAVGLLHEVV
ncbi:unnamed protein product [Fraxinus pennsylvanica]|uniref:Uncharacterized protein n=1 Tax=Fraxinus pennsylvanica TaxID=56036 RepID=A0AAD1ZVM5_9LAMI|nr:unnamed protein product [Fraxinus pennsylvanica]